LSREIPYTTVGSKITLICSAKESATPDKYPTAMISVLMGFIAISIHWLSLVQGLWGVVIIVLIAGTLAMTLGAISSFGIFVIAKNGSNFGKEMLGFYGFLLGVSAIVLTLAFYFVGRLFLWG
jgi:uncharacterized membrane protein YjjP (DUF1212 family)